MLEVAGVSMVFGGLKALNNVSLVMKEQEIRGLIGPNGSGKTTFINVISGFYSPVEGKITYQGADITGNAPYVVAQHGIVRTFQNINLFPQMTVLENVITGHFSRVSPKLVPVVLRTGKYRKETEHTLDLAKDILSFVELYDDRDLKASHLPYGKQRMLEIARALMTFPQFLILDEPVAGMNEQESAKVSALIQRLRAERKLTILLIEHHMRFVMNLCEKLTVLNAGSVIAEGNPSEIQNNKEVIAVYLGTGRKKC